MKIYWSGDSKNVIGPKVRTLRKQKGLCCGLRMERDSFLIMK